MAISGGGPKSDFSISASNSHQESNVINNGAWERSNLTGNLGMELAKGLTFRSISQLAYTKSTLKTSDRTIVYGLLNAYPFADFSLKTTDGTTPYNLNQTIGINASNPLYYQDYTRNNDNKVDIIQNFNLHYSFPKFVELDAKYGLNYQNQNQDLEYLNQSNNANIKYWLTQSTARYLSNYNSNNTGDLTKYTNTKMFQNFLANATFSFDFQKDFGLNIPIKSVTQAAFDWRNSMIKQYTSAAMGLPSAYEPYIAIIKSHLLRMVI